MSIFLLPIGIALPTVSGWLLLRILERSHPVLFRFERWILGFVVGLTFTMFVTFFVHIGGLIDFTRTGFLTVQVLLSLLLGLIWFLTIKKSPHPQSPLPTPYSSSPTTHPLSKKMKILLGILGLWTLAKIIAGSSLLVMSPAYYDDVYNNWNMRGKIFYVQEQFTLVMETGNEIVSTQGVSSYPPTVPMVKTWLSTLNGSWSEGLVNSVHMLWYLCALILVFYGLRRMTTLQWSLIGTYILASLPLFLMHGASAYADVFLSVHIFAALSLLFFGIRSEEPSERASFLRLSALATGLLVFTKNESLILYLPPIILLLSIGLFVLRKNQMLSIKEGMQTLLWYIISIAITLVPWTTFKWMNDLAFGNAKPISGQTLSWQEGVLHAVSINTFFEGNWVFLFPLFIMVLVTYRKVIFQSSYALLAAFVLIVYFGQLFIYMFTGVSTEALRQTGYARGLIHLAPVICLLVTAVLAQTSSERQ